MSYTLVCSTTDFLMFALLLSEVTQLSQKKKISFSSTTFL